LRFRNGPVWAPRGIATPDPGLPLIMTGILWASRIPVPVAHTGNRGGQRGGLKAGLAAGFALGAAFLVMTLGVEWPEKLDEFGPTTNAYGSLFYTLTGFHGAHVLAAQMLRV